MHSIEMLATKLATSVRSGKFHDVLLVLFINELRRFTLLFSETWVRFPSPAPR
jgi:hypothetical protein